MSGIYIHIPFCKQACTYCDFHFSTSLQQKDELVEALCKEMAKRREFLRTPPETLYFGGGSPSILDEKDLKKIFKALNRNFDLGHLQEVTLESNPDDHSPERLKLWQSVGINRLSIGIQSFADRDLRMMNRAHNSLQALSCVKEARDAGFDSLSIDLIYGIPGQSMNEWQENLDIALSLGTDHISAYCLTVEEKTALNHQVKKGLVSEKPEEDIEAEYHYMHALLELEGYVHYEISNFAKVGKEARHNSSYWSGKPYLGLGPSAHSFDGEEIRSWNVSNNAAYIKAIKKGEAFYESEELTKKDRANEIIMTGLRTRQGIDKNQLPGWTEKFQENLGALPLNLLAMLIPDQERVRMNPEYWLQCNAVIRELMF